MTSYNNFDSEIYSDERAQVSPEEFDEVMQMLADEHEAFTGYSEWSVEAEKKDYLGGYSNNNEGESYNGIAI